MYVRRLDPFVLTVSLSLYRHPSMCILCRSRFTSYKKQQSRFSYVLDSEPLQMSVHFPSSVHILSCLTKTPNSQTSSRGEHQYHGGESIDTPVTSKLDPNRPSFKVIHGDSTQCNIHPLLLDIVSQDHVH